MDRRARALLVVAIIGCEQGADTPMARPPERPCEAAPRLRWPLDGQEGRDWVVNNHFDRDPSPGLLDAWGETGTKARTVDGHVGLDISISSLRRMERGVPVLAVAEGQVETVTDHHPDRSTHCDGSPWNLIEIRTSSGHLMRYGHLATASSRVSVDDSVLPGQPIADVGSSGCSQEPHLHLEVRDCNGWPLPPLADELFDHPPSRTPSPSILETFLLPGHVPPRGVDPIKRAGDDIDTRRLGEHFTVAAAVGNVDPGDQVTVRIFDPGGQLVHTLRQTMEARHEISFWYWNLTAIPPAGTWTAAFSVSGADAPIVRSIEIRERAMKPPTTRAPLAGE